MEHEEKEMGPYPMEEDFKGMEVTDCNIKMAKGGYIVSCGYRDSSEKENGSLEHRSYKNMSEVFTEKQENKAWKKYRELKTLEMHRNYKKKEVY